MTKREMKTTGQVTRELSEVAMKAVQGGLLTQVGTPVIQTSVQLVRSHATHLKRLIEG
jgi:hypothetical protein